jgi:sugar phosphate isomerase/epimerase
VPTPEISVQLYSIHQALDRDLDGSLARLADIGVRAVEAFDFVRRADALKESFDRHGLSSPTAHAILIEEDGVATPDGLLSVPPAEETFAAAELLGVRVVFDPFVAPHRWTSLTDVKRNADRLNALAYQAADHGLRVGYHNHDHELTSQIDGRSALEAFADLLDPSVLLEVDLYWAAAGGVDPVSLVRSLGDRVHAVHVKDGPMRPGISARTLPTDQLPAGRGDVPLAAVLSEAHSIAYAVIEFDHYEGDIFEGITESYRFLTSTLSRASG